MKRGASRWIVAGILAVLASPLLAPQLLAFPYHGASHGYEVWSEAPLPQDQLYRVTARAAKLVAASPLADPSGERRRVFLTRGGWRWNWLALQTRDAFALTRAAGGALLINESDLAADKVRNRYGRTRGLSRVIAHETCHGMERRAFGMIKSDVLTPQWLREGYCDHVAQESTLSEAEAAQLKATGSHSPALVYFEGRKRVERELATNGKNVAALFAHY